MDEREGITESKNKIFLSCQRVAVHFQVVNASGLVAIARMQLLRNEVERV